MPSTSNPDEQIIKALVARLEESSFPVLLGYSIADLPDIELLLTLRPVSATADYWQRQRIYLQF